MDLPHMSGLSHCCLADEKQSDGIQAEIMFMDELMYLSFIYIAVV